MRDLNGDAGAVAGDRVRRDRTAVREVYDGLDRHLHDAVVTTTVDVGDEAGSASVVLERRVVQRVGGRAARSKGRVGCAALAHGSPVRCIRSMGSALLRKSD